MLITIIAFLFVLAFSITIHEFGHFIAAKICGIPVEKFSIGFGPPLIRIKIGETDFRIAYFPLGGYVKMAGDDEGELPGFGKQLPVQQKTELPSPADKDSLAYKDATEAADAILKQDALPAAGPKQAGFYDAPIYKRILVVFSGPLFNILSAAIIFIFVLIVYGVLVNPYMRLQVEPESYASRMGFIDGDSVISVDGAPMASWDDVINAVEVRKNKEVNFELFRGGTPVENRIIIDPDSFDLRPRVPPTLGFVKRDGPADKAGMKTGDIVISINNQPVRTWDEMVERIRPAKNVTMNFEWTHGAEHKTASITPLPFYDPLANDTVGQIGALMPLSRRHIAAPYAVLMGCQRSGELLWLTLRTLWQLIIGKISRRALGGPIAIFKLSGESARWGFENLLSLIGIISINLGLVNLFPLPAFDGGHIIMGIVEALRKKRFSQKTRLVIQQIGYAIILLIIVYVTFNDITR
ncbi:MAG TPA: RIP metalloprotease RseP [bacterium]